MTRTNWIIDNAHTGVHFSVRHMMITNVRGEFQTVSGTIQWDSEAPEQTQIEAEVDASSISTRNEQRDGHLKSPDFLAAEQFPKIRFRSTAVEKAGADRLLVKGELTIRDVTRPVTLDVEGPSRPSKDPFGNVRAGATATTKFKRSEFGITWNSAIEAGGVLVGDELTITVDVSAIKKD